MVHEAALANELAGRHGVTVRSRLRRRGLTDRVIDGLIGRGRLIAAGNGVLIDAASPDTFERRVAVACAVAGGVASFPTAGTLWAFRKTPRVSDIHVTVPWRRHPIVRAGITVHRSTCLPACDIVHRRDGISLTAPPRTAFDAAGFVSPHDVESIVEQGIDRRMFIIPTLWALNRRMGKPARAGSAAFGRVLGSRDAWRKPVRSDYELRLERALRARGFPSLTREHPIEIGPGTTIHPDLGLPDDGFFIEVDHLTWHGGRAESAYDRWRDRKARRRGYAVERVTDLAIDEALGETVEDLWELWQAHRARSSTVHVDETTR